MGGEVLAAIAVTQLVTGLVQGGMADEAADLEAQGIEAQAEADVNKINRELDEALSMQSAIFGAQGRVMEGSTVAVQEGDKRAAKEDIAAVRAGAEASSAATRQAGKAAKFGAIAGGILGSAETASRIK